MTSCNGNGAGRKFECVKRLSIDSICVYLASNEGRDPSFGEIADRFGEILAENEVRLINGGGGRGCMRRIVKSILRHGGVVTSVTPVSLLETEGRNTDVSWHIDATQMGDFDAFIREVVAEQTRRGESLQIIVDDMGIRKKTMYALAKAFVALPGGVGTLEEIVEQITWRQLGRHGKPIGFLNHRGFYDPLLAFFRVLRNCDFVTEEQPIAYAVAHDVELMLPTMCGELESRGRVHKASLMNELFGVRTDNNINAS